jgi:Flp pilus assembly pilin Flp
MSDFLKKNKGEATIGYGVGFAIVGLAILCLFLFLGDDVVAFYDSVTEVMRSTHG